MSALRKPKSTVPANTTPTGVRIIRRRTGEADISLGGPVVSDAQREAVTQAATQREAEANRRNQAALARARAKLLEELRPTPDAGRPIGASSMRSRVGRSRGY